jgi:hypothetical protein
MPKKRGRPQVSKKEYKGEVFSVRLSQDEAKRVLAAIAASGKKKPVWMREALLGHAKRKSHYLPEAGVTSV